MPVPALCVTKLLIFDQLISEKRHLTDISICIPLAVTDFKLLFTCLTVKCIFFPLNCLFFFFFFNFWLCWVFVAAHGLSLVVASGGYSSLRCAGFSLRWLLLLRSMGSRRTGFSSCSMQAQ